MGTPHRALGLFACAVALAIAGICLSVYGIAQEHVKPACIGFVLILGSAIFAILYVGARKRFDI